MRHAPAPAFDAGFHQQTLELLLLLLALAHNWLFRVSPPSPTSTHTLPLAPPIPLAPCRVLAGAAARHLRGLPRGAAGGLACMIGPVHPTFPLARAMADLWMLFPTEEEYIHVRWAGLGWAGLGACCGWVDGCACV